MSDKNTLLIFKNVSEIHVNAFRDNFQMIPTVLCS